MNTGSPARRQAVWRSRWAAIGAAVAVTLGAGGLYAVNAASSTPSTFVSIDPVRILDTRDPTNIGLSGPFVSATSLDLLVSGSIPTTTGTKVVVPAGATAVSMNVTVVNPTASGFVSIRPADATGAPAVSSLNFDAGEIVPNAVTVQLPATGTDTGRIEITYDAYGRTGPTTDILIDVVGYHTDAALQELYDYADAIAAAMPLTVSDETLGYPFISLTPNPVTVVSAVLTAPADGKVTVVADALIFTMGGREPHVATCSISSGSGVDDGHEMYASVPPGETLAGNRVFDVVAGQTLTYALNCSSGVGSSAGLLARNAHLSATFALAE
jgi:hypothetical protein